MIIFVSSIRGDPIPSRSRSKLRRSGTGPRSVVTVDLLMLGPSRPGEEPHQHLLLLEPFPLR